MRREHPSLLHTLFTPVPESPASSGGDERKSYWGFSQYQTVRDRRYGVSDFKLKKPHLLSWGVLTSPISFVILVTVLGGILRFYNLNWDQGLSFHPDERNIAAAVSRISFFDQLDPQFFAYGGLTLYLIRAAGELLSLISGDSSWLSSWGKINLIGRGFSALFSTLTIPAIYFLSRSLFPQQKRVALYATFFAAFTVSFIQIAHFAITESLLAFLVVLLCFFSLKLLKNPRLFWYGACGLVYGIAVATKTSSLSFLLLPFAAHLAVVLRKLNLRSFLLMSLKFIDLFAIAVLVFVLFSPHTFLSWNAFMESMRYESGVAIGRFSVPYTLQFTNTPAYFYQLKNLGWQLGPLFVLSISGLLFMPLLARRIEAGKLLVFLLFPYSYFLFVGFWHTKFIRFMFPLLPFLIIAASLVLDRLALTWKALGRLVVAVFSIVTVFWALAFFTIYTREQTRISGSRWIYRHVPEGSIIFREHWDDGLPFPLNADTPESSGYHLEELTIYEPDTDDKLAYYAERLSQGDFLVINSRRLYGTLIHLTSQYPVTSRYYTLLFDGGLGYQKVAEFSSYPSLFGISINDDASEETFQVYEHPKVMIFQNRQRLSEDELMRRLL